MSTMIQIRRVPRDIHRRIKARAALAGTSMSEWALAQLTRSLERPTSEELLDRVRALEPVSLDRPAADFLREERAAR